MELFDALTLARLQFAFTVSFHIVFPAFTIGLASYLAVLEGLWLVTGRGAFLSVFNYWKKIFALSFGMGVVSIGAINSAIIAGRRRPAMRSTLRASSLPPTGGRDLQSLVPLPPRAHGARRVSHYRLRGGCRRCVESHARQHRSVQAIPARPKNAREPSLEITSRPPRQRGGEDAELDRRPERLQPRPPDLPVTARGWAGVARA
jgi:hypothetical protein